MNNVEKVKYKEEQERKHCVTNPEQDKINVCHIKKI